MSERSALIENNIKLVHSCCKHFTNRGLEYDDMFQAGCIGLVKAADGFDEERGLRFSTYAVPVILGEIKRLFRDGGAIKVSRTLKELSLKVTREKEKFERLKGVEPTVQELAQILNATPEEISEAICSSRQVLSLTYEDEDGVGEIELPSEDNEKEICLHLDIERGLKFLELEEQKIIKLRFFTEKTQTETAEILNISQVQVSRKEKKALQKLKRYMENYKK